MDGNGMGPSTNGTWLYLNEEFEVYDGLVFKSHQVLFQVRFPSSLSC